MASGKQAFIWDLDGTLLDSYEEVVSSALLALKEYGLEREWDEVKTFSTKYSVKEYFKRAEKEAGHSCEEMYHRFHEIQDTRYHLITAEPGAKEILQFLKEQGISNYVFTHRNKNALLVLENLGLLSYFDEVLSIADGFARKPAPDGLNYLVKKYQLDQEQTYYVGDRSMDMDCAKNAGLRRILYLSKSNPVKGNGSEEFVISSLREIEKVIFG